MYKLFTILGGKFEFPAQDSDLAYLFWRSKNPLVSSDLKPPLMILFLLLDSVLLETMEVKCNLQEKKVKSEDVPKFPSRKEEQTFDCFNKTVIVYYILYYFMQGIPIKSKTRINNWKLICTLQIVLKKHQNLKESANFFYPKAYFYRRSKGQIILKGLFAIFHLHQK